MTTRTGNTVSALLIGRLAACLVLAGTCVAQQADQASPVSTPASGKEVGTAKVRFLAVDHTGNPIDDLRAEEFSLRIDNGLRKIVSLSPANGEPRTIGLFFDISGSRRFDKVLFKEVQATAKFLESVWRPADGGFVIVFNDRPYTLAKPTTNLQELQAALQTIPMESYRGSTALNDALSSIRFGPQSLDREKVFVVVSDFQDNSSRKSKEEMIQTMQTDGVRVFILLRPLESETHRETLPHDKKIAKEVAEKTGGDVFVVTNQIELDAAFQRLIGELHGAYRLAYEPLPSAGNLRKLELKTTRPDVDLLYPKKTENSQGPGAPR